MMIKKFFLVSLLITFGFSGIPSVSAAVNPNFGERRESIRATVQERVNQRREQALSLRRQVSLAIYARIESTLDQLNSSVIAQEQLNASEIAEFQSLIAKHKKELQNLKNQLNNAQDVAEIRAINQSCKQAVQDFKADFKALREELKAKRQAERPSTPTQPVQRQNLWQKIFSSSASI